MAWTYTVDEKTIMGNKRVHYGTYTNTVADTGGDIVTGLRRVEAMFLQPTGAAVIASAPSVYETIPLSSGTVTIVNTAAKSGLWMAIGY